MQNRVTHFRQSKLIKNQLINYYIRSFESALCKIFQKSLFFRTILKKFGLMLFEEIIVHVLVLLSSNFHLCGNKDYEVKARERLISIRSERKEADSQPCSNTKEQTNERTTSVHFKSTQNKTYFHSLDMLISYLLNFYRNFLVC